MPRVPRCNCIEVIDEALVAKGVRLSVRTDPRPDGSTVSLVRVMVEWLTPKRKRLTVNMLATYCPFCGVECERP